MAHRQFFRFRQPYAARQTPISRAAAAVAVVLPLAALGQDLNPEQLREVGDDRTDVTHENLTIDQIEDMNVVRENTLVGEIEEVLVNDQDEIVAVVIDAASRSPGGLEREVILPIEELEFDPQTLQASTTLTADEIAALPLWRDD